MKVSLELEEVERGESVLLNSAPGEGEEPRVEGGVESAAAGGEVRAQRVVEQVLQFERGGGGGALPGGGGGGGGKVRERGRDRRHGEGRGADAGHPHARIWVSQRFVAV